MKIDLLKTFISVVKHNSVSKASEEVFLTQPAVSKQIRILEKQYGAKLFEKEKNRLFLTEGGKILLNYAYSMLALYNESIVAVNEQKDQVKGILKMGSNLTIGIYVLPRLFRLFGDNYPELKFEVYLANTEHIISAIKRGAVNFGFIGRDPQIPSLVTCPFYKDHLKVVIGPKLGLEKRTITWKELGKIPFISREQGSDIRDTYETWFKERPLTLRLRIELNNTEAIKIAVHFGLGFSILPWCTIEQEVRWGFLQTLSVPYFDPLQNFYVSHFKKKKFSKPERLFLEYIYNFIEKEELLLPPI
jgi:DNA-binding transcriptional LysR family regulator